MMQACDFPADGLRLHGYQAFAVGTVPEAEATRQRLGPGGIDLVIATINLTPDPTARGLCPGAALTRLRSPLPAILISGDPSLQALPKI